MKDLICNKRLLLVLSVLFLFGCSTASVAQHSGFLKDYSGMKEGEYFKEEHIAPDVDFSQYEAVKVKPIDFDYLANKSVYNSEDLKKLGKVFCAKLEKALNEAGFKDSAAPGKTLVISAAITGIERPDAAFNVATKLSPVPVPIDKSGTTAFEAKITDGVTGEILVSVAEKQSGRGGGMDIKAMAVGSFTKYVNTEAVFGVWSKKIAKMLTELKEGKSE